MAVYAAQPDARAPLHAELARRNRVVGVLRWAVPVVGAAVLALLVVQIGLDNAGRQFGFSNIRIDRDNLVVDTPRLTSTGEDGTLYSLGARAAKVAVGGSDRIDMQDAEFTMTPPTGLVMAARAAEAEFQTTNQLLDIPGITEVTTSDGLSGTLTGVFADLINWNMVADGPVALTMSDGSTLTADGMNYDGTSHVFSFTGVTVTLASTPGETQ